MIRWKTYKTFIAPIIEVFLPAYIMSNTNGRNFLNKFHHFCMSSVLGVPRTACIARCCHALGEDSFVSRTFKCAVRLQVHFAKFSERYTCAMRLRSGRETLVFDDSKLAIKDFCDRVNWMAHTAKNCPDQVMPKTSKFNLDFAIKEANEIRLLIHSKIRHRLRYGN